VDRERRVVRAFRDPAGARAQSGRDGSDGGAGDTGAGIEASTSHAMTAKNNTPKPAVLRIEYSS